jgi:hypothetical protein
VESLPTERFLQSFVERWPDFVTSAGLLGAAVDSLGKRMGSPLVRVGSNLLEELHQRAHAAIADSPLPACAPLLTRLISFTTLLLSLRATKDSCVSHGAGGLSGAAATDGPPVGDGAGGHPAVDEAGSPAGVDESDDLPGVDESDDLPGGVHGDRALSTPWGRQNDPHGRTRTSAEALQVAAIEGLSLRSRGECSFASVTLRKLGGDKVVYRINLSQADKRVLGTSTLGHFHAQYASAAAAALDLARAYRDAGSQQLSCYVCGVPRVWHYPSGARSGEAFCARPGSIPCLRRVRMRRFRMLSKHSSVSQVPSRFGGDSSDDDDSLEYSIPTSWCQLTCAVLSVHGVDASACGSRVTSQSLPATIIITGGPGCGKSHSVRALRDALVRDLGPTRVAVCASFGICAQNVGGRTLHSWAGIGLGTASLQEMLDQLPSAARRRWRAVTVLLIDEISLLSSVLFWRLEALARHIRGDWQFFGGIVLVLSGDFMQLLPSDQPALFRCYPGCGCPSGPSSTMCAQWVALVRGARVVQLTGSHRLEVVDAHRERLLAVLQDIRMGQSTELVRVAMTKLKDPLTAMWRGLSLPTGTRPVHLFTTRRKVVAKDREVMASLPGSLVIYPTCIVGDEPTSSGLTAARGSHSFKVGHTQMFKVGQHVMHLTNRPDLGLLNGSAGTISRFIHQPVKNVRQMLMTANVHRHGRAGFHRPAQWDLAKPVLGDLDLTAAFGKWSSLQGLSYVLPVVLWRGAGDGVAQCFEQCVLPSVDVMEHGGGDLLVHLPIATREAMTIHKAVGMSFPYLVVDLAGCWCKQLAYEAISRAESWVGLQVIGFEDSVVGVELDALAVTQQLCTLGSHLPLSKLATLLTTEGVAAKAAVEMPELEP